MQILFIQYDLSLTTGKFKSLSQARLRNRKTMKGSYWHAALARTINFFWPEGIISLSWRSPFRMSFYAHDRKLDPYP